MAPGLVTARPQVSRSSLVSPGRPLGSERQDVAPGWVWSTQCGSGGGGCASRVSRRISAGLPCLGHPVGTGMQSF